MSSTASALRPSLLERGETMKRTPMRRRAPLRAEKQPCRSMPFLRTGIAGGQRPPARRSGRPEMHRLRRRKANRPGASDPVLAGRLLRPAVRRPALSLLASGLRLLPHHESAWRPQLAHAGGLVGLISAAAANQRERSVRKGRRPGDRVDALNGQPWDIVCDRNCDPRQDSGCDTVVTIRRPRCR